MVAFRASCTVYSLSVRVPVLDSDPRDALSLWSRPSLSLLICLKKKSRREENRGFAAVGGEKDDDDDGEEEKEEEEE